MVRASSFTRPAVVERWDATHYIVSFDVTSRTVTYPIGTLTQYEFNAVIVDEPPTVDHLTSALLAEGYLPTEAECRAKAESILQ